MKKVKLVQISVPNSGREMNILQDAGDVLKMATKAGRNENTHLLHDNHETSSRLPQTIIQYN